jgi:large subunit ribosomal protein L25
MNVPLHFVGAEICPGVKLQGGSTSIALNEIAIRCLPNQLPEFIEVDMSKLKAGQNVHISDLKLPEGVESVSLALGEDHDLLLCSVNQPRGGKAADVDAGGEG